MKYQFTVHNWKSDIHMPFKIIKSFPSAFMATLWANRISFTKKNSPYMVIVDYGKETK